MLGFGFIVGGGRLRFGFRFLVSLLPPAEPAALLLGASLLLGFVPLGLLGGGRRRRLDLHHVDNLDDVLRLFEVEDAAAVDGEGRLDVADLVVLLHRILDAGDCKLGELGVDDARGKVVDIGVVDGELGILRRVRHRYHPSNGKPLVEREQRLAIVLGSLAEVNLEGVRGGVRGSELAHAERGGHVGGEEPGAHRHRLVRVEVQVQLAAAQRFRQRLLDARHARRAADGLDDLDVLQGDVVIDEGVDDGLEGTRGASEDALLRRERLEIFAGNRRPKVDILVHALDGQRRLLVGAEDLLGLADLLAELGDRLGGVKGGHGWFVLGVEFGEKVFE